MSWGESLDNFIGEIAPVWAMRRTGARNMRGILKAQNRAHEGARRDRTFEDWFVTSGSADADNFPDMATLRNRSRDLIRNDGYAAGIIDTILSNVIGTGIRPQSRIDGETIGMDERTVERIRSQAERGWRRWVNEADITRTMDFYGVMETFGGSKYASGDSIALMRRLQTGFGRGGKLNRHYALALELVEGDRLGDSGYLQVTNKAGGMLPVGVNQIRGGVEIDPQGEPVAYHVQRTHPGESGRALGDDKFERVAKVNAAGQRQVIHWYDVKRPGQTRGLPLLGPVLGLFRQRNQYEEAELVAARVAACYAMFIKRMPGNGPGGGFLTEQNDKGEYITEMQPGMVVHGQPGDELESFTPNRGGGSFDPFMTHILRHIAAGTGQTYEQISRDFSRVNYSSARAALLEARRWYRREQVRLTWALCVPVWEALLEEMWLRGEFAEALDAATFYRVREDVSDARWIAQGWPWIDPEKEVNASLKAIDGMLSTIADEAASQGRDVDEIIIQAGRETRWKREEGLIDREQESEIIARIAALVPLSKKQVYALMGYEPPADEDDTIEPPAPAPPGPPMGGKPGEPAAPDEPAPKDLDGDEPPDENDPDEEDAA